MTHLLPTLLLLACCLIGLLLVPLGLPGLWVMALSVIAYGWLTDFRSVGVATIGLAVGFALAGELVEWWLGFRLAERYGGSRRAGWGALLGGLIGAVIGVPIPILGSVIGGFVGSFLGAAALEYLHVRHATLAIGAGWGAVLGRAAGVAAKIGLGVAIAVAAAVSVLKP